VQSRSRPPGSRRGAAVLPEYDGEVLVEDRLDAEIIAAIEAGFQVRRAGPWGREAGTANALGAVLAIRAQDGIMTGAADPRRDGYAVPAFPNLRRPQ
jgi:hypothetical protein